MNKIITISLLFWQTALVAQNVGLVQYYNAPLLLNPAMTSLNKDIFVSANYKSRTNGEIPFETQHVAGIYPIIQQGAKSAHIGGVGLSVLRDMAGDANFGSELNRIAVNLSFAYNQKLDLYGAHFLTGGVQLGYTQTSITSIDDDIFRSQIGWDGYNFTFPRPVDITDQQTMFSTNLGVFYIYNSRNSRFRSSKNIKIYSGVSAMNLNRPNQSFTMDQRTPAPLIVRGHGGVDVDLLTYLQMSVGGLLVNYSGVNQYNFGTNFTYKKLFKSTSRATTNLLKFTVGGWYRLGDMYTLLIGGSALNVNVAFSADINANAENYFGRGQQAYELSLSYTIVQAKKNQKFSSPLF